MSHSFVTGGGFAGWSTAPTQVRLLPSHGNWEAGRFKPLAFNFYLSCHRHQDIKLKGGN